ncbi:sensor domain-containing diguanylate cyclase [Desulfocurvus sp. DL9XJH121]
MTGKLFMLLLPFFVLVGSWTVLGPLGLLPAHALRFAPCGVALVAALACWRFRRSRAVPVLGLAVLAAWFAAQVPGGGPQSPLVRVVYPAFALCVPLNVLLASLVGDRGVFNSKGLGQMALYGVEALAVLFAASGAFGAYDVQAATGLNAGLDALLHWRVLPPAWDAWTPLPQPALLAGLAALALLQIKALVRNSPMDGGLGAGLAGILACLHAAYAPGGPEAWGTAACLALAAPLFQESYRMAFLDELTGLPARRALMADLAGLSGRYSLAMADVDHFKKFNDTYGHDVGDDVLRMVASHLGEVAGGGRAYRYGGEEFTLVFPRKSADEAYPHTDAAREAVGRAGFTVRGPRKGGGNAKKGKGGKGSKAGTVSVTISMGLAESGDGAGPAEVLKAADKALYKAKKKGRNQVVKAG